MVESPGKQWELIKMRKQNNVTQADMASKLGINLRTYTMKESGNGMFNHAEMVAISKYFNVTLNDIFFTQ